MKNSYFITALLALTPLLSKAQLSCSYGNSPMITFNGTPISPPLRGQEDCHAFLEMVKTLKAEDKMAQALNSPDISEIKPFKNGTPDEQVGFPQKNCRDPLMGNHTVKAIKGYITPECAPDTLYSWGGFNKAKWFLDNLQPGFPFQVTFYRDLFTTTSASATFGYGAMPIRFKIKAGTKFKVVSPPEHIHGCQSYINNNYIRGEDIYDTIIAKVGTARDNLGNRTSYLEYNLCSANMIESWSFGTKENFDEILRDHAWMTSKPDEEWEGYSKENGKNNYLNSRVDIQYGNDFSQESFDKTMRFLKILAQGEFSKVVLTTKSFFESSIKKDINQHFQTDKPIYFNPQ